MRVLRPLAALICLAGSLCVRAELLPIRSYTTADGLAADRVNRIVADSRGFLWFCTPEGLSRFDGFHFVNFGVAEGLPHRDVSDLLETRSGMYLAATARGVCRFQPGGGSRFTTYAPAGNNSLHAAINSLIETPSGGIWCGTDDGPFELLSSFLFRPHPLAVQPEWDRVAVTSMVEDRTGQVWVGTATGLYLIRKNAPVEHFGRSNGLPDDWVNTLLLDREGRIWAGTRGGLALMRDAAGRLGVERAYTQMAGPPNVHALVEAPDGSMWMGTPTGINRLPPGGGSVPLQHLSRENGLTDLMILSLARDKAGNLWMGTEGAGVVRIAEGGFTTFREADGLASDRLMAVFPDRAGRVCAVSSFGRLKDYRVSVFNGTQFQKAATGAFAGLLTWGNHQILLQARDGRWWGATKAGLCRFPEKNPSQPAAAPPVCYAPGVKVYKVFEDSKGRVWASGQSPAGDRLIRWDPSTKTVSEPSPIPNAHPPLVNAFAEDRGGNVWLGALNGPEIYRFDGCGFTRFPMGDGLGSISALLVDGAGRLWIGASNGLCMIEHPAGEIVVRRYRVANGLASERVMSLTDDAKGRIYIGTGKGIDRLEPSNGHIKHFSTGDGLAHGEPKSAIRDRSGDLWFATTQGLSRLRPGVDRPPSRPSILITDLRFGRERYPLSQAGESTISRGKLPPSQNHIQVEFAGFNNEPEESLRYTYKLEGAGSDWQPPSREHQANYPGLLAGSYRLLVEAVNSNGEASAPAEVDFIVMPTLVGSWWFRTLAALAAAAMIYLFYRYRLTRALEMERLRFRIATDLHDDIGSSLSQIAILSEVTGRRVSPEHKSDLADIANLSRELVDSMSEIVWAIDPSQDRLGDLVHRMRRFSSDLFVSAGVEVRFHAPVAGEDEDPEMKADVRRQIFLVFKEALHNAARHAACTQIEIDFCAQKGWLELRLKDNGNGFDAAAIQRGHGLTSMEQRAAQLGGELKVASAPGHGTTISMRVPLGPRFMARRKNAYTNG